MTTDRTVRVERLIDASPEAIFDVLATPARHAELDGSGMLDGRPKGPERLGPGDTFSMAMHQGRMRYRSVNVVTVFEENRAIAWSTGGDVGPITIGGHWWRYDLQLTDAGTLVTHSYEWGRSRTPRGLALLRYPQRMEKAMGTTLERLDRAVTS